MTSPGLRPVIAERLADACSRLAVLQPGDASDPWPLDDIVLAGFGRAVLGAHR